MYKKNNKKSLQKAVKIFQSKGGILRYNEAIKEGIHSRTLYELKDLGIIEQLDRGLYAIVGLPGVSDPDLVTVSKKVPKGVICLISALNFHGLTNQIPHYMHIAIPQQIKAPKIEYPPVRFYWFSKEIWESGIEEHIINKIKVKVYSKEKTIVDCFKHRNKIGIEVSIEALRNYWESGKADLEKIQQIAKISKVEKVIKPYLETIINEQS